MTYYKNLDVISLIKNLLMMTVLFPLAVSSSEDFDSCSQIEDSSQRLNCFDRLSKPAGEVELTIDKQNLISASRRIEEEQSEQNRFSITPHKPNYLLPVTYNKNLDSDIYESLDPGGTTDDKIDRFEAKFQVSFKIPLADNFLSDKSKLWFAYTQVAFWQLYNFEFSAPFRETNYEPELILSTETDCKIFGFTNSYINLALNHQSNGRAEPLSVAGIVSLPILFWKRIIFCCRSSPGTVFQKTMMTTTTRTLKNTWVMQIMLQSTNTKTT